MSDFLDLVKAERQKQINKHGYTPEHDDKHWDGSIADAAACYAATGSVYLKYELTDGSFNYPPLFPWNHEYLKKEDHDRKEQLIIAAALINAEYDRLDRIYKKATVNLCDDCNLCPATCGASPKFGTGIGNDNVYECDTFQHKPYQMQCPYGYDMAGHSDE